MWAIKVPGQEVKTGRLNWIVKKHPLRERRPRVSTLGLEALDFGTGSERGARSEDKSWQARAG